jgi:putative oxidoreductase
VSEPQSPTARWISWAPYLQSLLRMVAAFLFITPGMIKMFGYPMHMPPGVVITPGSMLWFAEWIEMIAGPLLFLGLFTRPVAFITSGEMAVAYFTSHAPNGFWPVMNNGQPAVFLCFIWLYFSAAGAGAWSIDAWRQRRKASS